MANVANPKALFYSSSLYIALTAGEWASEAPAKALKRTALSWPELLRKFRKHCPHDHELAEIASHTQALSLLVIRTRQTTPEALDGDHTHPAHPLTLGKECLLREERHQEAQLGYDALQKLPKSDAVSLALAYYAYAFARYEDALSHLSLVNFDEHASSLNASNVGSASSTLSAPLSHDSRTTISAAGSYVPPVAALDTDIKEGKMWRVSERIRGRCLQGMAHESLHTTSPISALAVYELALPLLSHLHIPQSLPSSTNKASTGADSFTRHRELWRWLERLLFRAIVLSAKTRPPAHTHRLLALYHAQSVHWPPTFRPEHRAAVAQLHLHVLARTDTLDLRKRFGKAAWVNEVRSVVTDYRVLLSATTTFPRAGRRNVKVEEFVDLCMATWEAGGASGEQAGWVIDILWWATRFTFNSHRIYRHLTRTLYASGDTDLAKRTLRLYVQVVSKARETGAYSKKEPNGHREQNGNGEQGGEGEQDADGEPDGVWVETLVQGARMLCRVAGGIEEAKEAGELIRKAEERLDKRDSVAAAALKRVEGIWHACMAIREQEPATRPEHFISSLTAFRASLALHPSPSTSFHLALALARPGPARDLPAAIASARDAVEGDPREIRYWHLLGLLSSAVEDWKGARAVLEIGAGIDEAEEEREGEDSVLENGNEDENGNENENEHTLGLETDNQACIVRSTLLSPDATCLPSTSALRRPVPDYPPPTRHERFEHALQLRFTQLALIEHVDGPENASEIWLEVFGWVAARKGLGEESERRPPSIEPPLSEGNSSDPLRSRPTQLHPSTALNVTRTRSHSLSPTPDFDADRLRADIPINLIPPTPREETSEHHSPYGSGVSPEFEDKDPQHGQDPLNEKNKDGHDTSKGKKVQRIFKERVHKGQVHIHSISRKIGKGGIKHAGRMKRASSEPDFHSVLSHSKPYQASSIHSRQRLPPMYMRANSPEPPPPSPRKQPSIIAGRSARERRLLSNLWLTSAATFRRMGKIEQARGAIQEAEAADEQNEDVWVQFGLYFAALGQTKEAIASFHKALFIQPDHVPAFVHLTQQYLAPIPTPSTTTTATATADPAPESSPLRDNIDMAAGLLSNLTRGAGWDAAEAWYFLARARGLQGKRDRERECLSFALGLVEGRGVRDIKTAVGWCL
ncbi:hypothetical protein K439DRAFT_1634845 [Ramaria rubella]|nr:hypothetical protein K439DRAFT_1634845 [Ramaria rubella]